MQILCFQTEDGLRLGLRTAGGILDVYSACEQANYSPNLGIPSVFFEQGLSALEDLRAIISAANPPALLAEDNLTLAPPVPAPPKIICVGLNYRRHAEESGMAEPKTPVLFSKFHNSLAAPNMPIVLPNAATNYDYEAELVIVMGKRCKNISEAEALSAVLGYCNGNDLSARDLQMLTGQWLLGKTLDHFLPIGPYLVTADEIPDVQNLRIQGWLNGELRQDSNTADMIFSVAEIVSYISRYITLEIGDIILSGTPQGVILGMEEKVWLKAGDEYAVEVQGLGRLKNKLIAEGA